MRRGRDAPFTCARLARLRDSRSLGISREEEGRQRPGGAEGTREGGDKGNRDLGQGRNRPQEIRSGSRDYVVMMTSRRRRLASLWAIEGLGRRPSRRAWKLSSPTHPPGSKWHVLCFMSWLLKMRLHVCCVALEPRPPARSSVGCTAWRRMHIGNTFACACYETHAHWDMFARVGTT